MSVTYDLVVIGGGTAGLVSAAGGASLGAKVALVEKDKLGGDCLYRGCVPTKTLVRSAKVANLVNRSEEFGIRSGGAEVDFPAVMERMRRVIAEAGKNDDPDRFRSLGVDVYLGEEATFLSPEELSVNGRRLRARSAIIATGSYPTAPPVDGLEGVGYITNVEALQLEKLPRSMVVIGSGPIGCEFAQIFARFGSKVTMISSSPLPLPKEDLEVGELLKSVLVAGGVAFHGGFKATEARLEGGDKGAVATEEIRANATAPLKVLVAQNERGEKVEARGEEILVAAGRAPTATNLGLENAGVELEKKGIKVDERLRTTAENIYAAGDITGIYLFTHVAEYQGRAALRNALFPFESKVDHSVVP